MWTMKAISASLPTSATGRNPRASHEPPAMHSASNPSAPPRLNSENVRPGGCLPALPPIAALACLACDPAGEPDDVAAVEPDDVALLDEQDQDIEQHDEHDEYDPDREFHLVLTSSETDEFVAHGATPRRSQGTEDPDILAKLAREGVPTAPPVDGRAQRRAEVTQRTIARAAALPATPNAA